MKEVLTMFFMELFHYFLRNVRKQTVNTKLCHNLVDFLWQKNNDFLT